MNVLTIKQPWATLIMQGDKRFEFRSWRTKYRGDLLISAGKSIDKEAVNRLSGYLPSELPFGKILGQVTLVDCIKCDEDFEDMCLSESGDVYAKSSFDESFAWKLDNVVVFDESIDAKGKLSLWDFEL